MGLFRRGGDRSRSAEDPAERFRELLCGDVPVSDWRSGDGDPVGARFREATELAAAGRSAEAVTVLRALADDGTLETRDQLQAWSALRGMGAGPDPAVAGQVLGVVLDVAVGPGRDTLACYADGSCRYLNHSGAIVVVEPGGRPEVAELVPLLLAAGQVISDAIGPWEGPRPSLPRGVTRISLLCRAGLRFGQGPFQALADEPVARPAFGVALRLLRVLTGT